MFTSCYLCLFCNAYAAISLAYLAQHACVCMYMDLPLLIFSILIRCSTLCVRLQSTLMGYDSLIIFHLTTYADKLHDTLCWTRILSRTHTGWLDIEQPIVWIDFQLCLRFGFQVKIKQISNEILNRKNSLSIFRVIPQFAGVFFFQKKSSHIKLAIRLIFKILRSVRSHWWSFSFASTI